MYQVVLLLVLPGKAADSRLRRADSLHFLCSIFCSHSVQKKIPTISAEINNGEVFQNHKSGPPMQDQFK